MQNGRFQAHGSGVAMNTRPQVGYLCVIAAAFMWASSGTAGKALFLCGVEPFDLVQMRLVLAALLLGAALALSDYRLLRVRRQDLGRLIVLGAVTALLHLSYFSAIRYIQVAAAILLEYLAPVLVALYSICFLRERLSRTTIAALLLSLAGCYLVVGGYDLELLRLHRLGIVWGLSAAVAFAAYALIGERGMRRYSPWTVLMYALLFAAVILNTVFTPLRLVYSGADLQQWGYVLYIVVVGTILPFGLFYVGISHIRSTRASIVATLEPMAAAVMAYVLLGECLAWPQILGGIAVLAAVIMLQARHEPDERAPRTLRARLDEASARSRQDP